MLKKGAHILLCASLTLVFSSKVNDPYFWHITDFHYDPFYWTTQESCTYNISMSELGKFGHPACDPPWELLTSAIEAMQAAGPAPDFIVWTGDTCPHPKNKEIISTERVIEILKNTTNLIKETFPDTPVYVTLGNHDYFPSSQMPGENNQVYDAAADLWSDWIDTEEAQQTFRKGGYYTKLIRPGLRAVIVNTNLYYSRNKVTKEDENPGGQYDWVAQILANARMKSEKIHVITHIPTGVFELPGKTRWIRDSHNERFNDIMSEYGDVIVGSYSSHQHFDTFRLFYDENGRPVAFTLISPSLTPWTGRVPPGIIPKSRNPGVRKVTYDMTNLHLTDVNQFWLDLPEANKKGRADWRSLYTFRDTYELDDITAASMANLLREFKVPTDELFDKYYNYNCVNSYQVYPPNAKCDCNCKNEHLCAIEFVNYDAYEDCISRHLCIQSHDTSLPAQLPFTLWYFMVNMSYFAY